MALALRKEDARVWTYRDYYNMPDDGNRMKLLMASCSRWLQLANNIKTTSPGLFLTPI